MLVSARSISNNTPSSPSTVFATSDGFFGSCETKKIVVIYCETNFTSVDFFDVHSLANHLSNTNGFM